VVTSRSVDTVQLPQTQARQQALLFALLLAVITVGVFSWLYVMLLRPLRGVLHYAERLADGHLEDRVEVRRYDEFGLICRALERIRVRLIRDATLPPAQGQVPAPNHASGVN
jgi:nitrate/nitrite-specific signal transduction histidine kinase